MVLRIELFCSALLLCAISILHPIDIGGKQNNSAAVQGGMMKNLSSFKWFFYQLVFVSIIWSWSWHKKYLTPIELNFSDLLVPKFPRKISSWNRSIAIQVPGTVNVNIPTDNSAYCEQAISLMTNLFGGTLVSEAKGTYISETMGLVCEKSIWIKSYTDEENFRQHLLTVLNFVCRMRSELQQEALLVEIDGQMYCFDWT